MNSYEKNLFYAKKGEPKAMGTLVTFCDGCNEIDGYPNNKIVQMKWANELKKLAANGNIIAQYEVARFDKVLDKIRTTETMDEIIALQNKYKKNIENLALQKNRDALYCIAEKTKDLPTKIRILNEAADLGSALACRELFFYHSNYYIDTGNKTANPAQQFFYAKKGANSNDYYAYSCQELLANCYYCGTGVPEDREQYQRLLRIAAQNGSYEAQETLKMDSSYSKQTSNGSGCYIATCVYGSYDCPQVWTLRRYRDFSLTKTWYGRTFIKIYYTVSPIIVKYFGKTKWFTKLWKGTLDNIVIKLQKEGYESTKYNDN